MNDAHIEGYESANHTVGRSVPSSFAIDTNPRAVFSDEQPDISPARSRGQHPWSQSEFDADDAATYRHTEPGYNEIKEWVTEEGLTKDERLARRLVVVANMGLIACPSGAHEWWSTRHNENSRTHNKLRASFTSPVSSDSRADQDDPSIGLSRHYKGQECIPEAYKGILRPSLPSVKKLQYLFSGTGHPVEDPQICLHTEDVGGVGMMAPYCDIDSFIITAPSLNIFKKTVLYSPVPQRHRNISGNFHFDIKIGRDSVMLRDIPHIYFGSLEGIESGKASIYMMFPKAYEAAKETAKENGDDNKGPSYWTDKEYKDLFDMFIKPAIREAQNKQQQNGTVSSYAEATAASQAPKEKIGGRTTMQESIRLEPGQLAEISTVMIQKLCQSAVDYPLLQEPFFCFDAMNLKLKTSAEARERHLITTAVTAWEQDCRDYFNMDKASSYHTDIGFEYFADDDIATRFTTLARTCCQANTIAFINGLVEEALVFNEDAEVAASQRSPPTTAHRPVNKESEKLARVKYYPVTGLRDCQSVTMEPTKRSELRKSGLEYFQSYYTGKRMWQDLHSKVFVEDDIRNLGYSKAVYPTEFRKSEADWVATWKILHNTAKRFIEKCNSESVQNDTAPSWRIEIRVDPSLRQQIVRQEEQFYTWMAADRANGRESSHDDPFSPSPHPANPASRLAFFLIPKRTYISFVKATVDKILRMMDSLAGYNWFYADHNDGLTAMFSVLFSYLQLIGGMVSEDVRAMLIRSPVCGGTSGFGLDKSMQERGFMFFPTDTFDWEKLKLSKDEHIALVVRKRRAYQRRRIGQGERDRLINAILEWLKKVLRNPNCENVFPHRTEMFVCEQLANTVIRAFRAYSIEKLCTGSGGRTPTGEVAKEILENNIEHSFTALNDFVRQHGDKVRNLENVRGNRTRATRVTGDDFWHFIWTSRHHESRTRWDEAEFRGQYRRIRDAFLTVTGARAMEMRRNFKTILQYRFFQSHTAISYPSENGTFASTNKKSSTNCYADRLVWFHQTHLERTEIRREFIPYVTKELEEVTVCRDKAGPETETWKPRLLPGDVRFNVCLEDVEECCRRRGLRWHTPQAD